MQIVNYKKGNADSKEVAVFDIYFSAWQMTFHNWKVLKGKKGQFIAAPSFYTLENNEKKYQSIITFSKEKHTEFYGKLIQLLKEYE